MPPKNQPAADKRQDHDLRIIGGKFRARKLAYHGDPVTRPMKHRVRESIFNLVGAETKGRQAFDLFAGTGALGLEAISRGAVAATFIERHIPTAQIVRQNIEALAVQDLCELKMTSAFLWGKRDLPIKPTQLTLAVDESDAPPAWLVFISPPYAFFLDRQEEMLDLITRVIEHAPPGSTIVVESDEQFDTGLLPPFPSSDPTSAAWDVRTYPPAVVAVGRKPRHANP